MIKTFNLLGVKVQTIPEYVVKETLLNFLNSDSQHQIVTVNPEFILASQKNSEFKKVINDASLATIDGNGVTKALQYLGHEVSLDQRLTGVDLTNIIISIARRSSYKILFCLNSGGLTKQKDFFILLKERYPDLEFQVADENTALEKSRVFKPKIVLVGYGAPQQDLWIYENMPKMPTVRVAIGVGGTFDFMSGKQRRAPKLVRSMGLEWLYRLLLQPFTDIRGLTKRSRRIYRAIIIFPYLVIKYRNRK